MHIKAIEIKEQLLGQEDYEVALSVGHLASLYNYDMNQYDDAEKLYLRSIAIGTYKCNFNLRIKCQTLLFLLHAFVFELQMKVPVMTKILTGNNCKSSAACHRYFRPVPAFEFHAKTQMVLYASMTTCRLLYQCKGEVITKGMPP